MDLYETTIQKLNIQNASRLQCIEKPKLEKKDSISLNPIKIELNFENNEEGESEEEECKTNVNLNTNQLGNNQKKE
jgi:hypothetical protein